MSAAPVIENVKPSRHAMTILEALLNAPSDEYEERLQEVLDYIAACENNANITALQASIVWSLRTQENQRKKIKKEIQKLPRFDMEKVGAPYMTTHEMKPSDLGDWLSFYDVLEIVR